MFVDHVRIFAKAGDGGNGSASLRREKFKPKGGPDGGDGGNGGDVVLEVDVHTDNLKPFFYSPSYKAESGKPGGSRNKTGKSGKHLVLKVPVGTLVYRAEPPAVHRKSELEPEESAAWDDTLDDSGNEEAEMSDVETPAEELLSETARKNLQKGLDERGVPMGELVADLTTPGQRFVLAAGGRGGKGNWNFRSPTNQAPVEFTPGTEGENGWFYFELRRIADVGLVGFPNAGKSTLLRAISAARPKVAPYPFTTLQPMVGVVEFPGFYRATVADIPGLIEGAHADVGLGHEFLRHILRCSVLLFVVDLGGVDGRDPISDIETLRREIKLYDEELAARKWLIAANKIDLPESDANLKALKNRFPRIEIIPISAEIEEGIDVLKEKLQGLVAQRPK